MKLITILEPYLSLSLSFYGNFLIHVTYRMNPVFLINGILSLLIHGIWPVRFFVIIKNYLTRNKQSKVWHNLQKKFNQSTAKRSSE